MPISSSVDYLPVMDEFIHHWAGLDQVFKLAWEDSTVGLEEFRMLRKNLDTAKAVLRRRLNDLELARRDLETARETAGERIAEFNRRIRAEFPAAGEFSRLPAVPARMAGRGAFLDAMDDALALWNAADHRPAGTAFSGPLLLRDGLSGSGFGRLRDALDQAFVRRSLVETALFEQRLVRQELQHRAKVLMTRYRQKTGALYAPDSPQVITLPRLTPKPQARRKPVPVRESGDLFQENPAAGPPAGGRTWTGSGTAARSGTAVLESGAGELRNGRVKTSPAGKLPDSPEGSPPSPPFPPDRARAFPCSPPFPPDRARVFPGSTSVLPEAAGGMLNSGFPSASPADSAASFTVRPPGPAVSWQLRIGEEATGGSGEEGSMFVLPLRAAPWLADASCMPPPRRKRRRRAWSGIQATPGWRRTLRTG